MFLKTLNWICWLLKTKMMISFGIIGTCMAILSIELMKLFVDHWGVEPNRAFAAEQLITIHLALGLYSVFTWHYSTTPWIERWGKFFGLRVIFAIASQVVFYNLMLSYGHIPYAHIYATAAISIVVAFLNLLSGIFFIFKSHKLCWKTIKDIFITPCWRPVILILAKIRGYSSAD